MQNALHALVHFYSCEDHAVQISQSHFHAALERYYYQYSSRPVCFNALRPFVYDLHPLIQFDFLEHSAAYAACLQQEISNSEVHVTFSNNIEFFKADMSSSYHE